MVLQILLVTKFLIDFLCFSSELAHRLWDRHFSFRVRSVWPIILIAQISHSNIFIKKVSLFMLANALSLFPLCLFLFLLLFFWGCLYFKLFFIVLYFSLLPVFKFLFLVLRVFLGFLQIQPISTIKVGAVRFANVIIKRFEANLHLRWQIDKALNEVCSFRLLNFVDLMRLKDHKLKLCGLEHLGVVSFAVHVKFIVLLCNSKGVGRFELVALVLDLVDAFLLLSLD